MQIDSSFELATELEEVWPVLLDLERIAPCLPGATVTRGDAEGRFEGVMRVKLGPVTSAFQGTLQIIEADRSARRVVLRAAARDTNGRGAAAATITSLLEPTPAGTRVAIRTDLTLSGTAGQFGRAVVQDVSQKLVGEFADRLATEIRSPSPRAAPAIDAVPGEPEALGTPPVREAAVETEALDLTTAGRELLMRRALPVGAAALVALLCQMVFRRAGRRRPAAIVINGPLVVVGGRRRPNGGRRG
jgi:carbon monoxide dehydrogenase subunit G